VFGWGSDKFDGQQPVLFAKVRAPPIALVKQGFFCAQRLQESHHNKRICPLMLHRRYQDLEIHNSVTGNLVISFKFSQTTNLKATALQGSH